MTTAELQKGVTIRFRFDISVGHLYNGHRSFYGVLDIGRRAFWLQRWDTARAENNRFLNADGSMGWTWGVRHG